MRTFKFLKRAHYSFKHFFIRDYYGYNYFSLNDELHEYICARITEFEKSPNNHNLSFISDATHDCLIREYGWETSGSEDCFVVKVDVVNSFSRDNVICNAVLEFYE